jgi:hypothetical protein
LDSVIPYFSHIDLSITGSRQPIAIVSSCFLVSDYLAQPDIWEFFFAKLQFSSCAEADESCSLAGGDPQSMIALKRNRN